VKELNQALKGDVQELKESMSNITSLVEKLLKK
jgi:hypothetical protein